MIEHTEGGVDDLQGQLNEQPGASVEFSALRTGVLT